MPRKTTERPRISPKAAALYRSKEGLRDREIWDTNGHREGMQELAWTAVEQRLWQGLGCERYLCDFAYRWLLRRCRSAATVRTYAQRLEAWLQWSDMRSLHATLAAREHDVGEYMYAIERLAAPRTRKAHLEVIASIYSQAEEAGLIEASPVRRRLRRRWRFDDKRVQKADGSRQALTRRDGQRMVSWCFGQAEPRVAVSVLLQLVEGLRSHEVAGLLARNYRKNEDDEGRVVHTINVTNGKGEKARAMPLPLHDITVAAIERYVQATRRRLTRGALLRSRRGGHYSPSTIQKWAKQAARYIGREEISSHDLRATCATLLDDRGARLREVQQRLGHASPTTTEKIYVRKQADLTTTTGLERPE